ncbi:hypothetical membrane protein [Corynebacterium renale]|uniref:DUF3068 domain-containing protein n=1 Tax=Corynebacterium renale TaxID=1724 RepID=UPI000DA3E960|nr:DUF3068 domain-containing protein [Corynebacterium renale]SQG64011.1 hypothetical membrane protein [Corynebacterium renale]STD03578.1 hypothetical membrane protein [Corynebacterium renale]
MLPKSRVLSTLLLGLGVALAVAGILAPRMLPTAATLPLDTTGLTWTIHAKDAKVGEETTDLTRQWHVTLEEPSSEENVMVRLGETINRADRPEPENLITATVWNYPMDRETGEAVHHAEVSEVLATPTRTVPIDGPWWMTPAGAADNLTQLFDPYLRSAEPVTFAGVAEVAGRETYRYTQNIAPTNVATKYAGLGNTTMLTQDDGSTQQGYLFYSAEREIFIDKDSGLVLHINEDVEQYYGERDGTFREPVLAYAGSTTEDSQQRLTEVAENMSHGGAVTVISWILLGLGALIAVVGAVGVFSGFGRDRKSGMEPLREDEK